MAKIFRTYRKRKSKIQRKQRISVGKSMLMRSVPKVHFHKVTSYNVDALVPSATGGDNIFYTPSPQSFSLDQVPNVTEFQALYDEYMILGVKVEILPSYTLSTYSGSGAQTMASIPGLHSAIDYTDKIDLPAGTQTFQTVIEALSQYATYRYTRGGLTHKRYLVPSFLTTTSVASSNGGMQNRKKWISTDDDTTPHFGLAFLTDKCADLLIKWSTKVTYYLAFRNTK